MMPGIVAESDLSGNLQSEYVFFNGERVARKDFSGNTTSVFYYFSDHLKTASVITDAAGNIKEDEEFYPWGLDLSLVNNDSNKYKYGGHEQDGETGLYYYGARHYSPSLSRFMAPDAPFVDQSAADPQSWNLYSYTRNNPTSYGDADGRKRSVCDTDGKNCVGVEDKDYKQFLKDHNLNEAGGNLYYKNPDGSSVKSGTVEYVPDNSIAGADAITRYAGGWIGPADRAIGRTVNHPAVQALIFMFAFGAGGAADGAKGAEEGFAEGAASDYLNITKGASVRNIQTNLTPSEFGANLEANGFTKSTSGSVVMYTKGTTQYTVYAQAKSTGGPTAQVKINGDVVGKIRLK